MERETGAESHMVWGINGSTLLIWGCLVCFWKSATVGRQKAFVYQTATQTTTASISPPVTCCFVNLFARFVLFSNKANCDCYLIGTEEQVEILVSFAVFNLEMDTELNRRLFFNFTYLWLSSVKNQEQSYSNTSHGLSTCLKYKILFSPHCK